MPITVTEDVYKRQRKDSADFWINMKGELVYIRYFAVRDENGVYQGTCLLYTSRCV